MPPGAFSGRASSLHSVTCSARISRWSRSTFGRSESRWRSPGWSRSRFSSRGGGGLFLRCLRLLLRFLNCFLLLRLWSLVLGLADNLAGQRVDVDFVDAWLSGGLEIEAPDQPAV